MPDWKHILRERVPALSADVAEEIAQHLEDRYRELRSAGAGEREAIRKTVAELRGLHPRSSAFAERVEPETPPPGEPSGARGRAGFFPDLLRDLRFAARTMRKNPVFALFVVLTLALGIGANTTVFTLMNTLILNPLPVPDSSRLAAVTLVESSTGREARGVSLPISYLNLRDYQADNVVFGSLAGYTSPRVITIRNGASPERIFAELVTGNYFAALALQPAAGRFFHPEEDGTPGAHPVAVMNYAAWQTRFGAAPDIVGRKLWINDIVFTIIGVAPPKFMGVNAIFGPDLWIPAAMAEQLLPHEMRGALSDRAKAVFQGVGRLKPEVSRVEAQANFSAIASSLERAYPEANLGHKAAVRPITDAVFGSSMGNSSPVIFAGVVLLAVVGVVLLIACSNVANLLLARAAARRHEIALRLAIGASRRRLIRQLLTESVLLGLLSGVVGLAIGYEGVERLWTFLPAGANFIRPKMDPMVLGFTLFISLLTGFVFGTIPALRASRVDVGESLKEETRTAGPSRGRITFANGLLVAQVAFSFILLMTAALFLRSIGRAYEIDPGFETDHLAVLLTSPGQAGYSKARTKAFYKEVRERVAALPGVESVSWASNLPLWGRVATGVQIEGHAQRSQADLIASVLNTVDLQYFETAGVAILEGRGFAGTDRENSAPVAIVNEKLARDYWPDQSALGKRIRLPGEKAMRQIVGVARTANYSTLAEPPQLCIYVPLEQNYSDAMNLYVRTRSDPGQILLPAQREVRAAGPDIWAKDTRTGRQIIRDGLFQARVGVTLLSVFGLVALALASVGLYGIVAYSVNQRTREIGVRMALGAARSAVVGMIVRQGMSLVAIGVAIGLAGALLAGGLLSRMLYGVSASDPASITGAAGVLIAIALLACYLPARRASRVDPLIALREG